jgi:hypothetical protein
VGGGFGGFGGGSLSQAQAQAQAQAQSFGEYHCTCCTTPREGVRQHSKHFHNTTLLPCQHRHLRPALLQSAPPPVFLTCHHCTAAEGSGIDQKCSILSHSSCRSCSGVPQHCNPMLRQYVPTNPASACPSPTMLCCRGRWLWWWLEAVRRPRRLGPQGWLGPQVDGH